MSRSSFCRSAAAPLAKKSAAARIKLISGDRHRHALDAAFHDYVYLRANIAGRAGLRVIVERARHRSTQYPRFCKDRQSLGAVKDGATP